MKPARRRGAAIAMIVLLLAAVQVVVIGGLAASEDEADQGVRRLLATRTLYAADGAGLILARQVRDGLTVPPAGTVLTLGTTAATVVSAPATLSAGTVVIDVRSDTATRRVRLTLDLSLN
jgi:hypothetical protein